MSFDSPPESVATGIPQAQIPQIRSLRQGIVIGLLAFSLLTLFLALFLIVASVRNDISRSEANLTAIRGQLLRLSTPAPELQELMITLTNTESLADKLIAARPVVGIQWPAVITVISNYNPTVLTLASLTQVDNRITLTGQAVDDVAVVTYTRMLEVSDLFTNVVLQSLTLIPPKTPTAQTTATPTAPASERIEFVIIIEVSV